MMKYIIKYNNYINILIKYNCNKIHSKPLGVCHTRWFKTSTTYQKFQVARKFSLVNSCLVIAMVIFCLNCYVSWGYWDILGSRSHSRISNIQENFELYEVFMHNFLCQNVPIFLLYILLTWRINTFDYLHILVWRF